MPEVLQLANHAAADAGQLGTGEEDDGVDAGKAVVDVGHLQLVLVVLDAAYAAQDGAGSNLLGRIDGEATIGDYLERGSSW